MGFDSVAPRLRPFLRACALPLALLLVFLYLVWRSKGAYPAVFADEWLYSSQARLLPFKDATLPSYLYLGVFHLTSACGAGFLDCARLFNSAFLVLAAPFLYQIARLVSSKPVAGALVLLSLLAPVNSYTSYFMPEAMYYCGFAIFSWAVLTLRDGAPWRYGLLCGSVLGLMSLVKIHALFLLPALLAFMLYLCGGAAPARRWRALASMSVCAVLAMVLTKSALAYLIAGPDGLNFLGSFYGGHARNSGGSAAMLLKLVGPALVSLRGHLLALLLLFAVPIAGIVLNRLQPRAVAEAGARGRDLAAIEVYALLMLGAAVVMTVAFTASVADAGPDELMRLHLRYYDFVFPLLLIGAAAPLGMPPRRAGRPSNRLSQPVARPAAGGPAVVGMLADRPLSSVADRRPGIGGVGAEPGCLGWPDRIGAADFAGLDSRPAPGRRFAVIFADAFAYRRVRSTDAQSPVGDARAEQLRQRRHDGAPVHSASRAGQRNGGGRRRGADAGPVSN